MTGIDGMESDTERLSWNGIRTRPETEWNGDTDSSSEGVIPHGVQGRTPYQLDSAVWNQTQIAL